MKIDIQFFLTVTVNESWQRWPGAGAPVVSASPVVAGPKIVSVSKSSLKEHTSKNPINSKLYVHYSSICKVIVFIYYIQPKACINSKNFSHHMNIFWQYMTNL